VETDSAQYGAAGLHWLDGYLENDSMDEQQQEQTAGEGPKKEQVETPLESVASICTVLASDCF